MPGMKFYSIYRSVDLLLPPDETKQRPERNRRARVELRPPGREPVNRGERTSTHLRRGVNGWIILRSLPGGEGGEPSLCGGERRGVSSFLAREEGRGGEGGEEGREEGRSLSRPGQPGGEPPPPGGRTGTRHPIKQCGTALHGQLSKLIKLSFCLS